MPSCYPGFIFSDNENTGLGWFCLLGAVQNEHVFNVSNMIFANLYCWGASQNVEVCEVCWSIWLYIQQGKTQDIQVNKKRVFLWLGDRMCLNTANSQLKQQYPLHCFGALWRQNLEWAASRNTVCERHLNLLIKNAKNTLFDGF